MNNIHSNTTFLNEAIDKKTDVEDEKTDLILANMIDLRKNDVGCIVTSSWSQKKLGY